MSTRHDRAGELVDDQAANELDEHEAHCVDGWVGDDPFGRPRPCPVCRPWITRRALPCGITVTTTRKD